MKPSVARRDTARLAASAVLLGCVAGPALGGDRALIDYIGYSDDGQYFAFAEFGVQDGSGFPYSNLYIVDLAADKWVAGSPYRVVLQDEEASVEEAREAALDQAGPKLEDLAIGEPAHAIAVAGDGEPGSDPGTELAFGDPGYGLSPVEEESVRTLSLETFPLQSSADCTMLEDEPLGFALSLDGEEIYRDAAPLPKSRGCTQGYKVYAVVRPAEWSPVTGGVVAIISSYPFGFEGPDRRFLVVPLAD